MSETTTETEAEKRARLAARCVKVRDALVGFGFPGKSVRTPFEGNKHRRARQPESSEVAEWVAGRLQAARTSLKGRPHVEFDAWLVSEFGEQTARNFSHDACAEYARLAREDQKAAYADVTVWDGRGRRTVRMLRPAWQVQEIEREAAKAAAIKAAKREADEATKAAFRKAFAHIALSEGRFLGYCELSGAMMTDPRPRWVYLLLGQDGAIYCGSTFHLRQRVRAHRLGTGGKITADRRQAWHLLHAERLANGEDGLATEHALLRSAALRRALLAQRQARALKLQARHGCAVPWLNPP